MNPIYPEIPSCLTGRFIDPERFVLSGTRIDQALSVKIKQSKIENFAGFFKYLQHASADAFYTKISRKWIPVKVLEESSAEMDVLIKVEELREKLNLHLNQADRQPPEVSINHQLNNRYGAYLIPTADENASGRADSFNPHMASLSIWRGDQKNILLQNLRCLGATREDVEALSLWLAIQKTDPSIDLFISLIGSKKISENKYPAKEILYNEACRFNEQDISSGDWLKVALDNQYISLRDYEQNYLVMQEREREFPESFPEGEEAIRAFGFRAVSGFVLKNRGDGYLTADNMCVDDSSPLRIAKAEANGYLKRMKKEGKEGEVSASDVEILSREYKIHLMPKPEMIQVVMAKFLNHLAPDTNLKRHISQYKVLLGEEQNGRINLVEKKDRYGNVLPAIAIYTESKNDAQIVLNTLCGLFKDPADLGTDTPPRLNQKIDSLIYYAQGSAGTKELMPDRLLEADKVHFIETFFGEHRLINPRTHNNSLAV